MANDGGLVATIAILVFFLAGGLLLNLWLYVSASTPAERRATNMLRLVSGWANIGNATVHLFLVVLLATNAKKYLDAGIDDAENSTGPAVLLVINGAIGIRTIMGGGPMVPAVWNTFVIAAGSLMPVVWPKFLIEGLTKWPIEILFIWVSL